MPAVLPDPDQAVAELETMQVGAVGVLGFLEEDRNFILRLGERLPVVLFHKPLEGSNLPYTMPDMRKAAQLASEFLARQGRRQIASSIGFRGHSARERLAADVRIEIEYHGIQWNDKYGFAPGNYETEPDETKEWIDRMLTDDPIPDAFLLYNNVAAEHLASELGKRRLTVGKDVDIVAFISSRGQPETAITWPTVLLNYPDSTLLASEMLQEALLSGAVPQPLQRFSKPSFKVPETR
jgi:DNA-binding LacI/PurR family transcriptional regulator